MIHHKMIKRINYIFIGSLIIFVFICCKLGYEQIYNHNNILAKAKDLWERDFNISGLRGAIVDRNSVPLAYDIPSSSLVVVPAQLVDAKASASALAKILSCDESKLLTKLTKKVSTQKIQPEGRLLSEEQVDAIEKLKMSGLYIVQDSLRYYPNDNYLAQTLGFSGIDNQGLAGLELQYNDVLSASMGSLKIPFDAKGHPIEMYDEGLVAPSKGMNLVLTIDSKIQDIVEREMNNVMLRYKPKLALALALDPNTGQILSMVSKPDFNPNNYQAYSSDIINRNLPIWMSFEPGSTFKSITFASALDLNLFDMYKDGYYDRGYELVGGARIKSWKAGGHGQQTFLQVLENSSNPGFVEISRRLGLDNTVDFVSRFGFGKKTGVDLPGESTGIVFKKSAMGPVEQATVAFGQGLSVTPIQLTSAFSALVNGGTLYEPYIAKGLVEPVTNDLVMEIKPKVVRNPIKKETSELMKVALESVVANGGGKNAYMNGYLIGGKTGTAQKAVNGAYLPNEYILSFISAAPINDPKIVLYIAIDSPQNDVQYGGTVVAPVAKAIYEDVLPYLNVPKANKQIPKKKMYLDPIEIKVNNYINKPKSDCNQVGLNFIFIGEGPKVIDQLPKANTILNEGGKVWIYLGT
ncbi:MAG: penicillin-binding transpeptidase domain-containing protein [Erysipelotrichaceae bacterium]